MKKRTFAIMAVVIAVVVALTSLNFTDVYATGVDNHSMNSYEESLHIGNGVMSTENTGRIWTDKSVFDGDINVAEVNVSKEKDEAFLVSYSALAMSHRITGKTQAPVDIVFVIDISGSMRESLDNGTRISKTVDALNTSIDKLMKMNPYTRVGVVAYSSTAIEILSLDHYTSNRQDNKYFYMSDNNSQLNWNVRNNAGVNNRGNEDIEGGTNTQMGMYTGMNMLATEDVTKVTIGNQEVQCIPSVVLLSDGAETYSSDSPAWWAPENNNDDGPGGSAYYGNGMKLMMTAAYMKEAINRNYGIDGDSNHNTTVYTIGMGTEQLEGDERDLANVTLNPTEHLQDDRNDMAVDILNAWNTYIKNGNPNILVDEGRRGNREYYRVTHPPQYDIDNINYVDNYYAANDASSVDKVFEEIVNSIAMSIPEVPTEIDISKPVPDKEGYITYTDPIGEYFVLKDMKALVWDNRAYFPDDAPIEDGNIVTYRFRGKVDSSLYGEQDLKDILVQVTKADDGKQTLTIKIPATLIPIHIQDVVLDGNGAVEQHISNGTLPMRIIYSVGFNDPDNPLKNVSDEYIANNTTPDGKKVNFYSNLYTGEKIEDRTIGNATTTFTPAAGNPFYFYKEDFPLYTDNKGANKATEIKEDTTYYYMHAYYVGKNFIREYKPVKGAFIKKYDTAGTAADGSMYLKAGFLRLDTLEIDAKVKDNNVTNTAEIRSFPQYNQEQDDGINDDFIVYMGNNGLLQIDAPPSLIVKKVVTADEGLTPPDKDFAFTVKIPEIAGKTVKTILHETGKADVQQDLVFDENGNASFKLKANQSLEIINVPGGSEYTVTEAVNDEGFELKDGEYTRTGTMPEATASDKAEDVTLTYNNHYSVAPIDIPSTDTGLVGTKNITGRDFKDGDEFKFTIEASQTRPDSPLPIGNDKNPISEVTIKPDSGASETFNFGKFHFDKPGIYGYVIKEVKPDEGIIGIDYDPTLYGLRLGIKDDGKGALVSDIKIYKKASASVADWELIYPKDDAGTINEQIVFTNGYNTSDASIIMEGKKQLIGKSLADIADDYSDDQQFKYMFEPAGSRDIGTTDAFSQDNNQPMPSPGADGRYIYSNTVAGVIQLPAITYTRDNVGKEYKYQIRELQPTDNGAYDGEALPGAVKNDKEQWVYKGFTFDNTVKEAVVTVTSENITSDSGEETEAVRAIVKYYNSGGTSPSDEGKVFVNSYAASGSMELNGTKNIIGRDFKEGDEFTFTVQPRYDAPAPKDADGNTLKSVTVTPKSGDEISINFGTFYFTSADMKNAIKTEDGKYQKTFLYDFQEEQGSIGGIKYDTAKKTIGITVIDDGYGNLTAKVSGDKSLEWNNVYEPVFTGNPVNIEGVKTLDNKWELDRGELAAGDFEFKVEPVDDAPMVGIHPISVNDANGIIKFFENATYDEAGTYQYKISEIIPDPVFTGLTYDKSEYTVIVKVNDDNSGSLTAATEIAKTKDNNGNTIEAEQVEEISFNNIYSPLESELVETASALKILEGKTLNGGDFEFKLSMKRLVPESEKGGFVLPETTVVSNDDKGKIKFGKIKFTEPGIYALCIDEIIPDDADKIEIDGEIYWVKDGITYDTHTYTRIYEVIDKDGKLAVTSIVNENIKPFENKYTAVGELDGALNLKVTKTLTGKDWQDSDEFKFNLTPNLEHPATKAAFESGDIILPDSKPIEDTTAEGSQISITGKDDPREKSFGNIRFKRAGTYQFHVWEHIKPIPGITLDTEYYLVTVKVTDAGNGVLNCEKSITKGSDGSSVDSMVFNNTFTPGKVTLGNTVLSFAKELIGRDWLEDESFTFNLTADDENSPMPKDKDGNIVSSITVKKPANGGNTAYFSFPGITYESKDMGEAKEKKFVYRLNEAVPDNGNAGMTYDTAERVITVTITDNYNGTALSASVQVTGGEDVRKFKNKYESDLTYDVAGGLKLTKTLSGRDMTEDQFSFEIVAKTDESAKKIGKKLSGDTIRVKAPAAADGVTVVMNPFDEMKFTQADAGKTYEYEVFEEFDYDEIPAGYAYDDTKYTVTINAEDNNAGVITVTTTVDDGVNKTVYTGTKDKPCNDAAVPFNNKYHAEGSLGGDANVKIKADKTLRGRDLKKGEFKFEVRDIKGNLVSEGSNGAASNGQSGAVTFDEIKYTAESVMKDVRNEIAVKHIDEKGNITYTYQYIVSEILTDEQIKEGLTKEDGDFSIKVVIADDGAGKLTPKVTYPEGEDSLEFKNAYNTDPLYVELKGVKVLDSDGTGLTIEDIAGKYEFAIKSNDSKAPMPEKTTVANDHAGNVNFGKVTLTSETVADAVADKNGVKTKTFEYLVTENGTVDGVVNDKDKTKTFTLTVKDNGKGKLSAFTNPVNEAKFTFTNIYGTNPVESSMTGEGGFTVNKSLEGRDMTAGEFKFVLKDGDKAVATGTNDADGKVSMSSVKFEVPGTYQYKLQEADAGQIIDGVTYDSKAIDVIAIVTDNKDGTLSVRWQGDKDVTFNNSYKPGDTSVALGANKNLTGRIIKEGEFDFQLKNEDGKVIQTKKNNANGGIAFDEIKYDKEGTYKYSISEVKGNDENITYDDTSYDVTVTVKDNGKGYLEATVEPEDGSAVVFNNTYTPKGDGNTDGADDDSSDNSVGDDSSKTGDNSNMTPFILMMIIAATVGVIVLTRRKIQK